MKPLWLVLLVLAGSAAYAQNAEPTQEAIDKLRQRLKDPDRYQRLAGMRQVGKLRARACIPDVVAALEDEDAVIQYYAITALGDLEAVEEIPKIRPFLKHPNQAITLTTIATLITLGDKDSVGPIVAMIEDPTVTNRWDIMKLVGMSGLPEAGPVFMKFLDNESLQTAAIMALGHMRYAEAGDKILPLIKNPALQLSGVEALGAIDAKKYAKDIRSFLPNPNLRLVAAKALAQVQDPDAFDALLEGKSFAALNFYNAPDVTRKLYDLKMPLRRVRNQTILQTAQAVSELSGVALEFSDSVGSNFLNAVFGMDASFMGYPSCFTVLSSFGGFYVEDAPGQLEWIATPEGIRIVTFQEAKAFWEDFDAHREKNTEKKQEPPPEK